MKTASLLAALNIAKPCLGAAESVLPVLSHFCFMQDALYAYDDTTAIIVEEATGLNVALHGDTLIGLLDASSSAREVNLVPDGARVKIEAGNGALAVPALAAHDFVFTLPKDAPLFELHLTEERTHAIELCMLSVSKDTLKPEFTGVTVAVIGHRLMFFSTDNATASRYITDEGVGEDFAAVLPEAACSKLLKLRASLGRDAAVAFGPRVVEASFSDNVPAVTLVAKVLPAKPHILAQVFDTHEKEAEFFPIPEGLIAEVRKAVVLLARESVKVFVLQFAEGTLTLQADGTMGRMRTRMACDSHSTGAVCLAPDDLLRVLAHVDQIAVNHERSLLLRGGMFTHLLSSRQGWQAAPPPAGSDVDDDIPF